MLRDLRKAVGGGILDLSDPDLTAELAYTRDASWTATRMCASRPASSTCSLRAPSAWQMRSFATQSYRRSAIPSESTQGQQSKDFDVY
jgi:hypothetical protein